MFDQQYPRLASWILNGDGWIGLGQDDFSRPLARILDVGGLIWESDALRDGRGGAGAMDQAEPIRLRG
jgi:hypothetical protein